jgi:chromosomal replication initiation ATPase DnaA
LIVPALQCISPRRRLRALVAAVAGQYGVGVRDVMGPGRTRPVAGARHAAYVAVIDDTGWPFTRVGRFFHRDRTTVRYGALRHMGMRRR